MLTAPASVLTASLAMSQLYLVFTGGWVVFILLQHWAELLLLLLRSYTYCFIGPHTTPRDTSQPKPWSWYNTQRHISTHTVVLIQHPETHLNPKPWSWYNTQTHLNPKPWSWYNTQRHIPTQTVVLIQHLETHLSPKPWSSYNTQRHISTPNRGPDTTPRDTSQPKPWSYTHNQYSMHCQCSSAVSIYHEHVNPLVNPSQPGSIPVMPLLLITDHSFSWDCWSSQRFTKLDTNAQLSEYYCHPVSLGTFSAMNIIHPHIRKIRHTVSQVLDSPPTPWLSGKDSTTGMKSLAMIQGASVQISGTGVLLPFVLVLS